MFVVPALAGIRAKNRLKAGLQTVRFQPRSIGHRHEWTLTSEAGLHGADGDGAGLGRARVR